MRRSVLCGLALLLLCAPGIAEAQGRGRPKAPRTTTTAAGDVAGSPSTGRGAGAGPAAAPAFRQFGAWLDDASVSPPGHGSIGIGAGHWRSAGASLTDVPIVDASVGIAPGLQLAASVPFYRSSYQGVTARGLDDVYLSAKLVVVDPAATASGIGLAVTPALEILSAGYTDDRVHWVLPVSVELRRSPVRVYGSSGYFSRGSLFGAGAVEWTTPSGTVLTGSLTQAISTADDTALGTATRTDVSVGLAQALTGSVSGWLSLGRSLASPPGEGTTLGIAGGISFSFAPPQAQP